MSSITRAMEKIDATEPAAPNAPPPVGAPEESAPLDLGESSLIAAAAAAEEAQAAPSAFVGDTEAARPESEPAPNGASDSTLPTIDDRTAPWQPGRVDPVLVAFHERQGAAAEQYRALRARLLSLNTARLPQILAITSSVPEEGKSVTTLNLGLVMAEGGDTRVLIVDADFRRSSLARMLGVPESPGLCEVLRGEIALRDAVQPTPYANLKLLPAGRVPDKNYADLLGAPTLVSALDELRLAFNYTLVDTPPVTTVSDVCLLAPHCDGVLMVVEMHRTPEPTVQQAVRTLSANNVKVLGCVLSRHRDHTTSYYERYYSSYYYHR